jgi:hypothetical protein
MSRRDRSCRRHSRTDIGQSLASLLAMFDVAAFTASRNIPAATKVDSFRCWIDPTHLLEQGTDALRVSIPAADSSIKHQLTATFSLTNYYVSNKAAAFWTGRHNGVSWEEWDVFVPTQGGAANALNTLGDTTSEVNGRSGAVSSYFGPATNGGCVNIQNATTTVAGNSSFGTVAQGVPTAVGFSAAAGVFTRRVKSNANVLTTLATPLATAPGNTLRLGLRWSGIQGLEARWFGKFVRSSPFSAADRARFFFLVQRLTGIAP